MVFIDVVNVSFINSAQSVAIAHFIGAVNVAQFFIQPITIIPIAIVIATSRC